MKRMVRENADFVCEEPCYVEQNSKTPDNPYRLTIYINKDGVVMLGAEGNGCGNDRMLDNIYDNEDERIVEEYAGFDLNVMYLNAYELRKAGFVLEADYVVGWIERKKIADCNVRKNS